MGDRSGDFDGHCITFTLFVRRAVWAGIVLLETGVTISVDVRNDHRCQNFIPVALSVKISIDDNQIYLASIAYSHPHHNRSTTKCVGLLDTRVAEALAGTAVNARTSVGSLQGESSLI